MTHGKTQMQTERQGESGKSTGLMRSLNGGVGAKHPGLLVAGLLRTHVSRKIHLV